MRQILPKDTSSRKLDTSGRSDRSDEAKEESTVSKNRMKWEKRASTGQIGFTVKKFTSGAATFTTGAAKTVVGGTKTVAKGTIGATKTVAKGTYGATKTVVGGTVGATKAVAGATYGTAKKTGKSARQAIEDVALFASPRVVQSKLNVGKNGSQKKIGIPSVFEKSPNGNGEEEKKKTVVERKQPGKLAKTKVAGSAAATAPVVVVKPKGPAPKGPKPMSIKEKAKAYETAMQERAKKFDITPNAPGSAPFKMHGKRTSNLGRFRPLPGHFVPADIMDEIADEDNEEEKEKEPTPKPTPTTTTTTTEVKKPVVVEEEALSPTSVGSLASETPEDDAAAAATAPTTTTTTDSTPVPTEVVEEEAPADADDTKNKNKDGKGQNARIDRETVILQEIQEIIRIAEETEIYDEIDDETIEILKESALQSKAYTKRWYDAYTDSFIHCPSLAQTIVDYTLLEIAEDKFQELYDEDFPMLYTVGLRGVACNWVAEEEEVPDYIYDLASDGEVLAGENNTEVAAEAAEQQVAAEN